MRKAKVELTEAAVRAVIERDRPRSLTGIAHGLGYKGSVSSTLTKKFRQLFPDIDVLLARTAESAMGGGGGKTKAVEPAVKKAAPKGKAPKGKAPKGKDKPAANAGGKWPRDQRNPFRAGAYGTCYDILAAHKDGLNRQRLVELLAEATGKDLKHAAFDCQVLLSARGNDDEPGLSRNDGPRHRSCRPGFWVKRVNDHVTLMVD